MRQKSKNMIVNSIQLGMSLNKLKHEPSEDQDVGFRYFYWGLFRGQQAFRGCLLAK